MVKKLPSFDKCRIFIADFYENPYMGFEKEEGSNSILAQLKT